MSLVFNGVTYGATPDGFVRPSAAVLLQMTVADAQATIDPALDVGPGGAVGQLFASQVDKLDAAWGALEAIYNSIDPDVAAGPMLVGVASLTGTLPTQPAASTCTVTMVIGAGASIPAGSLANVTGQAGNLWSLVGPSLDAPGPVVDTTSPPVGGTYTAQFVSTTNGPNAAPAGTLTVITVPVSGWTSVTNATDAVLGTNGYQGSPSDDTTLRQQREAELAASGASTVDALQAALDEIPGMISAQVYENSSNYTLFSSNPALPPKTFLCMIWDGVSSAVSNDVIAQTIWNQRPSGIQLIGNVAGTIVDAQGNNRLVDFERVEQIEFYVSATVTTNASFPSGGIALLKEQLALYCQSLLTPGADAVILSLSSSLLSSSSPDNVPGVIDVPAFYIGLAPSPGGTANLQATFGQVLLADTSRITINGS